jgi:phosphoribosylformylglycinamidine synthase subunit PurQ / glutaminase
VKAGILPGPSPNLEPERRSVTLTFNDSARFECRWVYLRANPESACLFTQGIEELIYCPVAHGEGRLAAGPEVQATLQGAGLIALTYVDAHGRPAGYPANPNGSFLDVAGLCNAAGNVLGLMPHPENHVFSWQAAGAERGHSGLRLFQNGIRAAAR